MFKNKAKITNDLLVRRLMTFFRADEFGHQADISSADLGYGWVHYGLIRLLKPIRVLCVGSRHGYIPAVLAQACKDNKKGRVDFVDPGYGKNDKNHWTGEGFWKTPDGRDKFRNFGLGKFIKLHLLTSVDFAKKHQSRNFGYVYIDGNHSYLGVKRDYKLFWPWLKSGGFMAFHDISITKRLPEGKYGVYRFWNNLKNKHAFEISFEGSGLGVIQKVRSK